MDNSLPFDVDLLPATELRAGSLTCLYERGNLRRIKSGGTELIRMIYGAVRDENWTTLSYDISDEAVEIGARHFVISYQATYRHLGNDVYTAAFSLEGTEDGTITVSMKGKALAGFTRNRIGLCVLHPQRAQGSSVEVTGPDAKVVKTALPRLISPVQVLMDIRAMKYNVAGTVVSVAFEGDTFETEDQRNWMDASYKTYSTPLAIPFPVELKAGDTMFNKVTIMVTRGDGQHAKADPIRATTAKHIFPAIGYEKNYTRRLNDDDIAALKTIPFDHYRTELDLDDGQWRARLDEAVVEARKLATRIELVIFFNSDEAQTLRDMVETLRPVEDTISHVLPLKKGSKVTPLNLQKEFYPLMKAAFPNIRVGYGTDAYFTELNRERPQNDLFDFVSFPLHPQAHANDTRTIIENLDTGPDIIATIRSFTDKPVFVSPVTLASRKNPDARTPTETESPADPRQQTWFGVAWTLLCLFSLGGVERVTMYQTTGAKGILSDRNSFFMDVLKSIRAFRPVTLSRGDDAEGCLIVLENERGERKSFNFAEEFCS